MSKLSNKQKIDFTCECGLGFNYPENWEIDKEYIRGTNLSRGDTVLKLKESEHNDMKNKIFISMFNKIFSSMVDSEFEEPPLNIPGIPEVKTINENKVLQNGIEIKRKITDYNGQGTVYKENTLIRFKSGRRVLLGITCEIKRKTDCLKEIDYIINSFAESE